MALILLVEDDPFLTTMYKTRFEKEGHQVLIAQDGEAALVAIKQAKPQLVLLDVMLPKMGGIAVLSEVKNDATINKIPIVVLSNLTDPKLIQQAKDLGVREFLIKANFTPTQIYETIKKYLGS